MASDIRSVRRRAKFVAAVVLSGLAGMSWRAWELSIEEHSEYAAQGNRQQLRTYPLAAGRGTIVDRNDISLAVNDRTDRVVLNPRQIRAHGQVEAARAFLTGLLGIEHDAYIAGELTRDKAYRMLKIPVDEAQAKTIRDKGLIGMRLEQEPVRIYPRGLLAAHILGRTKADGHGHLGVELGMDESLAGREASSPAYFASHRGTGSKLLVDGHPDHAIARGHSVVLTLDSAIQAMVEEEIDQLVRDWHPVGASVIALDPRNGEIMAVANRPSFDPNHPVATTAQTVNLAVQSAYEPGSTMKAITVAAALDEGAIRKNQTFDCMEGRWQYTPDHAINDTKRSGWLDVTAILAVSSNICTTKIYETLGKQSLHRWVRRFHFGERPEIQLPAAHKGLLDPWQKWSDIQAANISFGQGMSASPLQVAAAFGALANDGVYNAPTIVRQVIDGTGEVTWQHESSQERIIRTATAKNVLDMLTAVVHTRKGTGKKAVIKGYRVAGKTSTAQKAARDGLSYSEDRYYASFVGAVPADAPRVVILVSVDEPEGGHYGNEVAAPTFSRVGSRIMAYLGVPRDDGTVPPPETIKLAADDPDLLEGFIPDLDLEPDLPGRRKVTFTTGLPDFTGLTIAQAFDAAARAEVELRATGSGIAVGQDLPPGPTESGARVHVVFEPTD
jgi:cell division protein FtsI (penicillin-binding protein 3)